MRAFTRATDSIHGAVFITKRASHITTTNANVPTHGGDVHVENGEETTGGFEFAQALTNEPSSMGIKRAKAYETCWRAIDRDIARAMHRANAEAFAFVASFVRGVAEARATSTKRPDERVPVGVVLAGGVNSDDHEETFEALVRKLKVDGDAYCALLRSRDLKARGGAREGETAVAFGVIMRQLDRTGAHWHGKSARALKRWYDDVVVGVEISGGERDRVGERASGGAATRAEEAPGRGAKDFGASGEQRGHQRGGKRAVMGDRRDARRRVKRVDRRALEGDGDDDDDDGMGSVIGGGRRPVVIVVEDTEGFDARVLDSFLLSVAEYVSSVPIIVMLGLATSVSSLQGMLPASTAALLNARAFHLWAPGQMMEAVQEHVLLSPERVPAFGSNVLNVLHTRFKEHDFSLAAVRRALHLLTLTHFMTEPLSAACALLTQDASALYPDGDDSDDEYGDAIERFVDELNDVAMEYAHKKYGFATKRDLIAALRDVHRLRRRWMLSLRCIRDVCVATEEKFKARSTTSIANLLLDASREKYFDDGKSPGAHLINVACARLCDGFTTQEIVAIAEGMLKHLNEDEVMRGAEGAELKFLLMRVDDGSIKREEEENEIKQRACRLEDDRVDEIARMQTDEPARNEPATAKSIEPPPRMNDENIRRNENDENAAAVEAMMNARRSRGAGSGRFVSGSTTGAPSTTTTGAGGLVLPKLSPPRGRSSMAFAAPAAAAKMTMNDRDTHAIELAVVSVSDPQRDASASSAATALCGVLRAVASKYASRPPESLAASGLFVITDVDCVRCALQASPRLALENTLVDPGDVLGCSCCRRDAYDLHSARKIPKSLPDTAAAYRLLARFGEQANIHDWFQSFCALHTPARDARAVKPSKVASAIERGKGTFGLPREKLWELQARFTRAVAELEFLGIARPHQKGRKGVEFMVRTAFPLDKLQRDATKVVASLALDA